MIFEWVESLLDLHVQNKKHDACGCFEEWIAHRNKYREQKNDYFSNDITKFPVVSVWFEALIHHEEVLSKSDNFKSFAFQSEENDSKDRQPQNPQKNHWKKEAKSPFQMSAFPTKHFKIISHSCFIINSDTFEEG